MPLTTLSKRFLATWALITYCRHGSLSENGSTFADGSEAERRGTAAATTRSTPCREADGDRSEDRHADQDGDRGSDAEEADAQRRGGGLDHPGGEEAVTE